MKFSPVEATKHITEKYSRYLHTIFSMDNDVYNKQFLEQISSMDAFSAGPYLDVSDSFEKGNSIEQLIMQDILPVGFRRINIPLERPLHRHQEEAIRKAINGKNLIVSTGTGSGKTESFLIPILTHIIREFEDGTLNSGVRALLIYPMNALANDQVERLRYVLKDFPEITYGSYTGQTKNKYNDALVEYRLLNGDSDPLPNELISREQIKKNPPHILITNYAMLEYLMVRPGDSIFFSAENAQKWKYIVLDEAHVYNGSSGIEVSMLLRRLKARLDNDQIRYILTSATLGDKKSDNDVALFGKNLCDSHFDTDNIVRAYRLTPTPEHNRKRLDIKLYKNLAESIDKDASDEIIARELSQYDDFNPGKDIYENLYNIILHDENYDDIKAFCDTPRTLQELSELMSWTEEDIVAFVTVASKAEKNGDRLFDARYHMFLRASESVFVTLNPSNKLFLNRRRSYIEKDGKEYAVFEIAICSVCHAVYLIGTIKNNKLVQASYFSEENLRSVFLLRDSISDSDEDHLMVEENLDAEEYELCPRCGFIRKVGGSKTICCEHGSDGLIKVFKVQAKEGKDTITKCLACENSNGNGILRMFFTGQEAVTSVLGTALFEELPSYKTVIEKVEEDDDWGFGTSDSGNVEHQVAEAKQFIAFSDSRQAAAFFASYFDQTYKGILYKRLIVETLKKYKAEWEGKIVTEFVNDLSAEFENHRISALGTDQSIKEAWKAILHEMADNNGVTSLYNMGLIGFSVDPALISSNKKLGLDVEEVCTLCNILVLGMLADAAIYYNYSMNKSDREFFAHNGVEYSYTLSDPDRKGYRRSFIPRFSDKSNKRSDYFYRLMMKMGIEIDREIANKYLAAIWNNILVRQGLVRPLNGAYRVNCDHLMVTRPKKWYICPDCKKITPYNLRGVCPSYKCGGELKEISIEDVFEENHYYRMYQDLDIRDMKVVEHTAQLNRETAYEYQKKFKKKQIDVLSCSTTFEMGVDVGSLETVFMRNMPPSPANYAQRAGRAGRSKNSAAFALTFCNKSNHDFAYFANPKGMIRGRIDPPKFIVENDKIAIRHIYASALSYFWSLYPDYFDSASAMTEDAEGRVSGVTKFTEFLKSKPEDLKNYLERFLPDALIKKFDISNYGWLDSLLGDNEQEPGVLTRAVAEYQYEVGILKNAKDEALSKGGYVDRLTERIRVYQKEDVLSFFSRKNVMPKYGFPVDTVEMSVMGRSEKGKLGLQLQRDLAMAISEYAPGSQIVANGNLITSRYIRKIPHMSWKMYDYIKCECGTLNIEPHVEGKENPSLCKCHQCGVPIDSCMRQTFIVPAFGFEADGDKIEKPGLKKPERTYRGDVSYVGYKQEAETQRFNIGRSTVEISVSQGDEMAVINDSNFYVCEHCGYTELDEKSFTKKIKQKHRNSSGYPCGNELLKKYSLGYRFETDVLQLRFIKPDLINPITAISVLYGIIRGICTELNIEDNEIAGCLQYFFNEVTNRPNYALVFYDKTPGGAGHVRRLADKDDLQSVFKKTLEIMESCNCGGEKRDSSCYQCLRNYYNQKYHDVLSRGEVINFIKSVLNDNN